jgi:hypothetical protein
MSKVALSLKINVSQIDKARLFAGQKGKYLDCTIFVDLDQLDQYGNSGMITQDVTKEEKAQGVKGNILGNGKIFWKEGGQAPQQGAQQPSQQQYQPQQQQQVPASQQQQSPARQNTNQAVQQNVNQGQQQVNTNGAVDFDDDLPF